MNAADIMRPPVVLRPRDDLRTALESMLSHELRQLPVVDDEGKVQGFVDEAAIARVYLRRHAGAD